MIGNWLFDDARQSGDTDVLEVSDDYYVAVFHDPLSGRIPTRSASVTFW